jgi:hypothetical protein
MTKWWGKPPYQQDTRWITSLRLMATSLRSTSISTLNTCAGLGILNSRLSSCSSRFKILPTILKQGGRPHWAPATHQRWLRKNICNRPLHECMSPVERETYHRKKPGRNSNRILQPLTVNTSRCRDNLLPQLVTTLQMMPLPTTRIRWLKQPL